MFAMCVDATFTWLKGEKERQCQAVNDEINRIKNRKRQAFSRAAIYRFRGLPDASKGHQRSLIGNLIGLQEQKSGWVKARSADEPVLAYLGDGKR